MRKRIVIVGATSGMGFEVAKRLLSEGWTVGVAGRRENKLENLRAMSPDRVFVQTIDVTLDNAQECLINLISNMGGMDKLLLSSGIGKYNPVLDTDIELKTAHTNVLGSIRILNAAYNYFKENNGGHIAIISSIAGTKGIGVSPAYSATKRFQNTYIDALAQLSKMQKANIFFTDIRPGFVDTDLLNKNQKYPMLISPAKAAKHIVYALNKRKRRIIIDWRYKILVGIWKLIPYSLWERLNIHQ